MVARPVDSAVVAARAPCRVKCSVVTKVTAAGLGSEPGAAASPLALLPVVPPASARWSRCDYRSRCRSSSGNARARLVDCRHCQGPGVALAGTSGPGGTAVRFPARAGRYGQMTISPGKGPGAMSEPKTFTLEAPGAVLYYDVRDNGGAGLPVLLLAGAPMGASGFAALAEQFAGRTVVTYDPAGPGAASAPTASRPGRSPPSTPRTCAG